MQFLSVSCIPLICIQSQFIPSDQYNAKWVELLIVPFNFLDGNQIVGIFITFHSKIKLFTNMIMVDVTLYMEKRPPKVSTYIH